MLMPSLTVMVPNSIGKPPAARTPSFVCSANLRSVMLHGVTSFHADAMAICGLTQSSSVIPTARSIARAGALVIPSVTSRLRGLTSTGVPDSLSAMRRSYPNPTCRSWSDSGRVGCGDQPRVAVEPDSAVHQRGAQLKPGVIECGLPFLVVDGRLECGTNLPSECAAHGGRQPFLDTVAAVDRVIAESVERFDRHLRPARARQYGAGSLGVGQAQRAGFSRQRRSRRLGQPRRQRTQTQGEHRAFLFSPAHECE